MKAFGHALMTIIVLIPESRGGTWDMYGMIEIRKVGRSEEVHSRNLYQLGSTGVRLSVNCEGI